MAFDIFFDFETAFEQHQSRISAGSFYTHSGFSVEDLPSDFLGFLEGIHSISNQHGITAWKTLCGDPLPHDENVIIFEAAEKFKEAVEWKSYTHIPKLWIKENNKFTQFLRKEYGLCPCDEKETTLPPEFRTWHPNPNSPDYRWARISEHFACYEFRCLKRLDHPGWQRN